MLLLVVCSICIDVRVLRVGARSASFEFSVGVRCVGVRFIFRVPRCSLCGCRLRTSVSFEPHACLIVGVVMLRYVRLPVFDSRACVCYVCVCWRVCVFVACAFMCVGVRRCPDAFALCWCSRACFSLLEVRSPVFDVSVRASVMFDLFACSVCVVLIRAASFVFVYLDVCLSAAVAV